MFDDKTTIIRKVRNLTLLKRVINYKSKSKLLKNLIACCQLHTNNIKEFRFDEPMYYKQIKKNIFNSQLQLQSGITRQITLDSPELFVLTHFKWMCLKTLEYYSIV